MEFSSRFYNYEFKQFFKIFEIFHVFDFPATEVLEPPPSFDNKLRHSF